MADRRLAGLAGFLFCLLVLILLLILYYPSSSDDDEWTPPGVTLAAWNGFDLSEPPPSPPSTLAVAAQVLEDMGAAFLALLAVACIAFGLACLVCGCCCLA